MNALGSRTAQTHRVHSLLLFRPRQSCIAESNTNSCILSHTLWRSLSPGSDSETPPIFGQSRDARDHHQHRDSPSSGYVIRQDRDRSLAVVADAPRFELRCLTPRKHANRFITKHCAPVAESLPTLMRHRPAPSCTIFVFFQLVAPSHLAELGPPSLPSDVLCSFVCTTPFLVFSQPPRSLSRPTS